LFTTACERENHGVAHYRLAIPFGIWSLVVLNKPEVKDSLR